MRFDPVPPRDPLVEIDFEIALAEYPGRGFGHAAMTKRHAQARQQFLAVEGLGYIVVGAEVERRHLLVGGIARRDDEDDRVVPLLEELDEFEPVAVGQAEVEQHGVGLFDRREGEGASPVDGFDHLMPGAFERVAEQAADRQFVIDHQNLGRHGVRASCFRCLSRAADNRARTESRG